MNVVVVGNPGNRRVGLFVDAVRAAGLPEPHVVAWRQVVQDLGALEALSDGPALVRLDSWGEDAEVERALLVRGGFPGAQAYELQHGEVVAPRVSHEGFRQVLRELDGLFARRPAWRVLNVPAEVDELFDKRRTARRYAAHGLPVPDFLDEVPDTPAALLEAIRARGWRQAFVKPAMGSSASGVLHVTLLDGQGATVRTSLEWAAPRWFNNLKLRTYRTREDVERALAFVLAQGAQVEKSIEKARLGGAYFDCRVLCIAGQPRFVVARCNRHPITNLHLGGWRGDVGQLKASMAPGHWEAAMETCRGVARLYASLHVGIDLLFEPGFARHRVVEANAFGDLLPNLAVDGRTVPEWLVAEAVRLASASP